MQNSNCRLLKRLRGKARAFARSRIENGGSRIAIFYSLSSILKHYDESFSSLAILNRTGHPYNSISHFLMADGYYIVRLIHTGVIE
jgi:hypothetical protein